MSAAKEPLLDASFWRDRNVFVTGATGLLGSWLTSALVAAEANVVALVRDEVPGSNLHSQGNAARVTQVRGALEDLPLLQRAVAEYEIDTVFHLAAQTIVGIAARHPIGTFEANVRGTYHLLEACRTSPLVKRVVVASTDKVYGDHGRTPYTEDMSLDATAPYDVSKSLADQLALSYARYFNLPVATTRFGNLYGGGDLNWNRIVPGTIRSALRNERPVLRSDGQFVRDYVYVKDAVAAYGVLAEKLHLPGVAGRAYNFSDETPQTVVEIASAVLRHVGRSDLVLDIQNKASGEIPYQALSSARARETLGWRSRFTLDDGLADTVAWYRRHFDQAAK